MESDTCVFVNENINLADKQQVAIIICIYVDDGLVMSNNKQLMMKAIEHLRQKFEITINRPNMFVGLQISKADGILRISQTRSIKDLIKTYEMGDAKVANTPIPTTI